METPEPTHKDLMERFDHLEALIKVVVRQKLGNKADKLAEEVQRRGRISSSDAQNLFGTSRNWALNLMKKVGSQPGFQFVKGDIARKVPSMLVYDHSRILQDQYKVIDKLLAGKKITPFYELMNALGVDFAEVKLLINSYVETHKDCQIVGGNKLEKTA